MSRIGNLTPAHRGYRYQDILSGYILAEALVHHYEAVTIDLKKVDNDKIDDIEIKVNGSYIRRQIKFSNDKYLSISDFTYKSSSLNLEALIQTYLQDPNRQSTNYRLCATWKRPEKNDALWSFITPVTASPTINTTAPSFYQFDVEKIWPDKCSDKWKTVENLTKEVVSEFCSRFLIEIELPPFSENLQEPEELERQLILLLEQKIGIGKYPNQDRSPRDVAALFISLANLARTQAATLDFDDIIRSIGIRTDYGRISQSFPFDKELFVDRPLFRKELIEKCLNGGIHFVIGPPGYGKSWDLTQLYIELKSKGIYTAKHYCFLEPGDEYVERRITTNTFFGNVIAELNDTLPNSITNKSHRFSADLSALEKLLQLANEETDRPIVLIIDGLDHISRVLSSSTTLSEDDTDIIDQLSTLNIPPNVAIVIGSQPGEHLEPIKTNFTENVETHLLPEWNTSDLGKISILHGIEPILSTLGLPENEIDITISTLADKAEGNPLYARYLTRGLISGIESENITDPNEWINTAPQLEHDITDYYKHLYESADDDSKIFAELLGVIDFSVTEDELNEIIPVLLKSRVSKALVNLAPILTTTTSQGGIRIFHESFRRFMLNQFQSSNIKLSDVLEPVTNWLENKGFYESAKSFRFLLPLLRQSNDKEKIYQYVNERYAINCVAHLHSVEAIEKNLTLTADIAGKNEDWPILVRCSELRRAIHTFIEERQDELDDYYDVYLQLFGADSLAERLLFDGKPTLTPEHGLYICGFIDSEGQVAPWKEYLDISNDDDNYRVALDIIHGRFRIGKRYPTLKRIFKYFCKNHKQINSDFISGIADLLLKFYEPGLILKIASKIDSAASSYFIDKRISGILYLALAGFYNAQALSDLASRYANAALKVLQHPNFVLQCLSLGATPPNPSVYATNPNDLDIGVDDNKYIHQDNNVQMWVTSIRLLALDIKNDTILDEQLRRITGSGWYRCWLKYVIQLAKIEAAIKQEREYNYKEIFDTLTEELHPFVGEPRACDLYSIQSLITDSFSLGLSLAKSKEEILHAIHSLVSICDNLGTRFDREDGGPLPKGTLIELLLSHINSSIAGKEIKAIIIERVDHNHEVGTYYSTHAQYTLQLTKCYVEAGDIEKAKENWVLACQYLVSYGFHKDITIFEILENIPSLNTKEAISALESTQPLTDTVLYHTDGRETRHAPTTWFSSLSKVSIVAAIDTLVRTYYEDSFVENWMTTNALNTILEDALSVDTAILIQVLRNTLQFDVDHESESEKYLNKYLSSIEKLPDVQNLKLNQTQYLSAKVCNDGSRHKEGAIDKLNNYIKEQNLALPKVNNEGKGKSKQDDYSYISSREDKQLLQFDYPVFVRDARFIDLLKGIRNFKSGSYNDDSEYYYVITIPLSYYIIEYIENAQEDKARKLIHFFARNVGNFFYQHHPVADIALALENSGYTSLASVAYSLAYTGVRGGGGWLNLGDKKHSHILEKSFTLNAPITKKTISEEIAYKLEGIDYGAGISKHLVERLADWNMQTNAQDAWQEACKVITLRLPLHSPHNHYAILKAELVPGWTTNEALIILLLSRISEPRYSRKVSALNGIRLAVQYFESDAIVSFRYFLTQNTPTSSILLILDFLYCTQEDISTLLSGISDILINYSQSSIWGVRQYSEMLLEKNNIKFPSFKPIYKPAKTSEISQRDLEFCIFFDQGDSLGGFSGIWPELASIVAKNLLPKVSNGLTHKKIGHSVRRLIGKELNTYPATPGMNWGHELFIMELNEQLNGLNEQLWINGYKENTIEHELCLLTNPNTNFHMAFESSRVAQPQFFKDTQFNGGISDIQVIDASEPAYQGWIRLGALQTEYIKSTTDYFSQPTSKRTMSSGVVCTYPGENIPPNVTPFADGDLKIWWNPNHNLIPAHKLHGPLIGLDNNNDWLSAKLILTPPPILLYLLKPQLPKSGDKIVWFDNDYKPMLVLRTWRSIQAASHDIEPETIYGQDLIAHPDVLSIMQNHSVGLIRYLTNVVNVDL